MPAPVDPAGPIGAAPDLPALRPGASFVRNLGQFGAWPARLYATGGVMSVAAGDGWVSYDLHGQDAQADGEGTVVRVTFAGARDVAPAGQGPLGQRSNFLLGNDPSAWVTDVPHFRSVLYRTLWEGIDLELWLAGGELKYAFTVGPGADPSRIVMAYEGQDALELDDVSGGLLIRTPTATLRDSAPITYQEVRGMRVPVESAFMLLGHGRVGFHIATYDPRLPLVIDPGMIFSTFLGAGGDEAGEAVAVDRWGHIYAAGRTSSSAFPVTPGAYNSSKGGYEAFVARFSSNGSALEYSTLIGGSGDDGAVGVDVDSNGRIYVAGTTASKDFPTTSGAFCTALKGDTDSFSLRLDSDGSSLGYSTYLGGYDDEGSTAISVDANGCAYVSGWTIGADFPMVEGSFRRCQYRTDSLKEEDGFVAKLRPDGSGLVYSCILGGNWSDRVNALFVDSSGRAYVTGETCSEEFPTTLAPIQGVIASKEDVPDAFLCKLSADGRFLLESTFLGEQDSDRGLGIAVDTAGYVYVVGTTDSPNFPSMPARQIPNETTGNDTFILKLHSEWHQILYSKVLNLSGDDAGVSVVVDRGGSVCVVGYARGDSAFPSDRNAFQEGGHGDNDEAFLLRIDERGDMLTYASLLGGDGDDRGAAVTLDDDGRIYCVGTTSSAKGFPTTPGAYDTTSDVPASGGPPSDAFVFKADISIPFLVSDTSDKKATTGDPFTFNLTVADNVRVESVVLVYVYGFGGFANGTALPLTLTSGDRQNGSWAATIVAPSDSIAPMFYTAWAVDNVDLNATVVNWSARVDDNDLPSLEGLSPAQGGTGEELVLTVRAVDNVAIDKVAVLFVGEGLNGTIEEPWVKSGPTAGEANDTYEFTVVLPRFANGTLRYYFWANDTSGNSCATAVFELEVVDDEGLHLMVEPLPAEATTGQDVRLRVHARDNIGVAGVWFAWWYDGVADPVVVSTSMAAGAVDAQGNGPYTANLSVPFENAYGHVLNIRVVFRARDLAGNDVETRAFLLRVRDNDLPWLLDDMSDAEATTGDPFRLAVHAWDNIALGAVQARHWYDEGPVRDLPLARGEGGVWSACITIPDAWTALHYTFCAVDTSGNTNWSRQWDITVTDNDPPRFVRDYTEGNVTTGGALVLYLRVEDNLYLRSVEAEYWTMGGDRCAVGLTAIGFDSRRNGFYQARVVVPSDARGPLTYVVVAKDAVDNTATTGEVQVHVIDDDCPWFGADLSDASAWRGQPFRLGTEVWDNQDVEGLWCEWSFDGLERFNASCPVDAMLTIDIPLDPPGPLRYRFGAWDNEGNWARSREFAREVLNFPPRLVGLGAWNVTEGREGTLDLRGHILDRDDDEWVITTRSPHVTAEGYELRALYDVWVPDHYVELNISDGRVATWHNLTVHVLPVNDPPAIEVILYNGGPFDESRDTAKFKEGRDDALTVQAWDEEGDPLGFTWLRDGEAVATGPELRYGRLPAGTYALTLEVDDGTDVTRCDLNVSVTERVEPFASRNWVVLLLVLAVVALVIVAYRWYERARAR